MTEKITPQRVFNAAWQAFVVEDGRPAQADDQRCSYLTEDGRRCAFGLLLTPEQAAMAESYPPSDFYKLGIETDGDPDDLDMLQGNLHDNMCSGGSWSEDYNTRAKREAHYRKVAAEYGLTIPGESLEAGR